MPHLGMDAGHYLEEFLQELVVSVMELLGLDRVQLISADQYYHENLQELLFLRTYLKILEEETQNMKAMK